MSQFSQAYGDRNKLSSIRCSVRKIKKNKKNFVRIWAYMIEMYMYVCIGIRKKSQLEEPTNKINITAADQSKRFALRNDHHLHSALLLVSHLRYFNSGCGWYMFYFIYIERKKTETPVFYIYLLQKTLDLIVTPNSKINGKKCFVFFNYLIDFMANFNRWHSWWCIKCYMLDMDKFNY